MTTHSQRVLLIDGNPIRLDTLASTLRLRLPDAQIEAAESALSALERIRSSEYVAIVCDAHQPHIEGIGFVRAVRKVDPQLPVVLLLDKPDEDVIHQAMIAGAYDVAVDPVGQPTFPFAVRRAIETCRLRRQVQRERERLLAAMRSMMSDLEVLYGADGLGAHFEAFMTVEAERHASRQKDDL